MRRLSAIAGTAALALAGGLIPATAHAATAPIGGGGHIAFVRAGNIWIANPQGGQAKQLTTGGHDSLPTIRADLIVFNRDGYIWSMDTSGQHQQKWFAGHGASISPGYQPGRTPAISYVAVITTRTATWQEIRIADLAVGTQPITLENSQDECNLYGARCSYGPTTGWRTDDSIINIVYSFSYASGTGSQADPSRTLIEDRRGTVYARWIGESVPDAPAVRTNKNMVTWATPGKGGHVYTELTSGGKPNQITSDTNVSSPTFSPDNAWMLWVQNGNQIRQMRTYPGQAKTILVGNSPSWG